MKPKRRRKMAGPISTPFYRNAFFLTLSSAIMSGLGLPFWALATRHYSAENVGIAATLVSALMLISGVSQLGLNSIIVRYLPSAGSRSARFIALSYASAGVVSVVFGVIAALSSSLWSHPLRFLGADAPWFALFVLSCLVWVIFNLQDSVLTGIGQTQWVAVENAVFAIAKLGLVVLLAAHYARAGIFLAWTLPGLLLILAVNAAIFLRFLPTYTARGSAAATWAPADMRRLIAGNYIGGALAIVGMFAVPIIVAGQVGSVQAAYFYVPWTVSVGLSQVAANVTTSMVVSVAAAESRLTEFARRTLRVTVRLMLPAGLVLLVFAPYLLALFGHRYESHGSSVLRILALGAVPNGIAFIGVNLARVRHDGRTVAWVQGVVSVVTVGGSAIAVPYIGIEGAALAWLVAQVIAIVALIPTFRATHTFGGTPETVSGAGSK
jgi:O-antigen/teichoic acid export membrane protein